MIRFALRGMLGRKLRTALTAIGIVLGVALVSGTYVLTDSIFSAFDAISTENYKNTDAAITGKSAFELSQEEAAGGVAPPFEQSQLATVEALAGDFDGRMTVAKLNVDENPSVPGRFMIRGIPTLLLFKDGQLAETLVGLASKEDITRLIEKHLS